MPKMTDYVRRGFDKRRRPWEDSELPEWWNLAVWAGLAGVVAAVVLGVVFGGIGRTGKTEPAAEPSYVAQTVYPFGSPSPGATSGAASPQSAPPAFTAQDFTATAAVQVGMTGGGTAAVPAGARNAALAAARATATGDWTGVPLIGKIRHRARPTPAGTVLGDVTVADPSVSGTGSYLFSAKISNNGTAQPYVIQIAVELRSPGYAVRPR